MLIEPTDSTVLSFCLKLNDEESLYSISLKAKDQLKKLEKLKNANFDDFVSSILEKSPIGKLLNSMALQEVKNLPDISEEYNALRDKVGKLSRIGLVFFYATYIYLIFAIIYAATVPGLHVVLRVAIILLSFIPGSIGYILYRKKMLLHRASRKKLRIKVNGSYVIRKQIQEIDLSLQPGPLDYIDVTGVTDDDKVWCYFCSGKGNIVKECGRCYGKGYIEGQSDPDKRSTCSSCLGRGYFSKKCSYCSGEGIFNKLEIIQLYNQQAEEINRKIAGININQSSLDRVSLWLRNYNEKVQIWNSKLGSNQEVQHAVSKTGVKNL